MATTTYDFKNVTVTMAGFIVTGYMDGEPISVEKNEDDVIPHVGADGEVTYSESADQTGMITITLKQTSPVLKQIQSLRKSKEAFDISIVDNNSGKYQVGGTEARIIRMPSRSFGTEVSGVELQIHVAKLQEA